MRGSAYQKLVDPNRTMARPTLWERDGVWSRFWMTITPLSNYACFSSGITNFSVWHTTWRGRQEWKMSKHRYRSLITASANGKKGCGKFHAGVPVKERNSCGFFFRHPTSGRWLTYPPEPIVLIVNVNSSINKSERRERDSEWALGIHNLALTWARCDVEWTDQIQG